MICERCQRDVTRLILRGALLVCGGCRYAEEISGKAPGVIRDEIPGGFVQEHFGHKPETFYSWSAMRKRADTLGLQPFVRRLESIREGDYIDPQTLENARILLSRGATRTTAPDPGQLATVETSVKEYTWPSS